MFVAGDCFVIHASFCVCGMTKIHLKLVFYTYLHQKLGNGVLFFSELGVRLPFVYTN